MQGVTILREKRGTLKRETTTDALTGNERERESLIVFNIRHVHVCGGCVCAGGMGGRSVKQKSTRGKREGLRIRLIA